MKKIIVLSLIAVAVVAGAIIYSNNQKAPPPPAPAAESAPSQPEPQPQEVVSIAKPQPAPVAATPATLPTTPVATMDAESTANEETNSIRKTVDALLAARSNKHAMFQQMNKEQLDAVIAELQRRATENPSDAGIPTTLGEALLNKVRVMHEAGITDKTELGILALQADQQFNAALKVDPKNWEAQYVKASTMFYWPPDAERDADAAQRLANLIDQQETLASQPPQFAQTYLALIKQYQKMGKQQEAAATLKLALQKFPADPALQQMAAAR
jgi:tetratricopeptide (TPR) repeat protein